MLHLHPWAFLPFGILLGTAASAVIATLAANLRHTPPPRSAEILHFPLRLQLKP